MSNDSESSARVEETSRLIEGLLNMVSQMFTVSCRNSLKSDAKQSFNSMDLSSENHDTSNQRDALKSMRGDSAQLSYSPMAI